MDKFSEAFAHKFYRTREFAVFCSEVSGLAYSERAFEDVPVHLLKNKNIAISNYSESARSYFKTNKISYASVLPEDNTQSVKPSLMEYSIFHKTTYEEAEKKYTTSFVHGLREGRRFAHTVRIVRAPDDAMIEKMYAVYLAQMRRHNSFVFPRSFFRAFFSASSSLLFLIEYGGDIIAYFCCFEYEDNIYSSIGGGNPDCFQYRPSNKLYDELIRYACVHGLTIHMGIGMHGSGYQEFKRKAGAINYTMERFPNDDFSLKLSTVLLRYRLAGVIFRLASRCAPRWVVYLVMPFT